MCVSQETQKNPSPREYITVMQLGSGLAAVHIGTFDDGYGEYQDIVQTGMCRACESDRHMIVTEAKAWAESEDIPYV